MKSRLSYLLISIVIILLFFIGKSIWTNEKLKVTNNLTEKSFTAPISSKYIPKNADLIFHWKINPNIIPSYIDNYQDKSNKKIINKRIKFIRDSAFKLISIDYTKDISEWSGGEGSFAIFDINKKLLNDWLMVLEINKDVNIQEKLESILGPNITNDNMNSVNNSNISQSKLFSKKINQDQTIYFLNYKENILISSNPNTIKSSIDQIDDNKLGIQEKYKNIKLKDNLIDGILLLEMSPKKIFNLIGQKEDLLEIDKTDKLISSINIDNNKLILEGILSYDVKSKRPINDRSYDLIDMEKEFNLFDNLILINNPKQYFIKNSIHPYQKLIASVIQKSTTEDYSNLFKNILKNTQGNLILLKDKEWLAITSKSDKGAKEISDIIKKDKFLNTNLDFKNKNLEVWSKITTTNDEKYEIKENIEAFIEEEQDVYIWSQDLYSITNFDNKKYLENNIDSYHIKNENNDFDDVLKIHLGKKNTELFLNDFYPYILLRSMLGNKLDFPQNIDMSFAIPTINYPDFVKFKINLLTS